MHGDKRERGMKREAMKVAMGVGEDGAERERARENTGAMDVFSNLLPLLAFRAPLPSPRYARIDWKGKKK